MLVIIGLISGLLCGLYGVGALLAAYVSRTSDSNESFKANLCMVFMVENTFRIIMYCRLGIINGIAFFNAIKLMPFMLGGLFLGMKSSNMLSPKVFKKIVIVLLMLSGVALIINNLAI